MAEFLAIFAVIALFTLRSIVIGIVEDNREAKRRQPKQDMQNSQYWD